MAFVNIKRRIGWSMLGTFSRSALSFLSVVVLSRLMPLESLGPFFFLTAFLITVFDIVDLGSGTVFFTYICRKDRPLVIFAAFIIWCLFQLGLILILIGSLAFFILPNYIEVFSDQSLVMAAIISVFFQHRVWTLVLNIGEACRQTKVVQLWGLFGSTSLVFLLLTFHILKIQSLHLVFAAASCSWAFVSLFAFIFLKGKIQNNKCSKNTTMLGFLREFLPTVKPMIIYTFVTNFVVICDRWMLQAWGGNLEQAHLGLSIHFASFFLLIPTALIKILWKEIGYNLDQKKNDIAGKYYFYCCFLSYLFGSVLIGALVPWSEEITLFVYGEDSNNFSVVFLVIMFGTLHQSLNQISGAVLMAAGKFKAFAMVTIFYSLFGLPLTFLLLKYNLWLDSISFAGAFGLAIKVVVIQFFCTTTLIWVLNRQFSWKGLGAYQFIFPIFAVLVGFLVKFLLRYWENALGMGTVFLGPLIVLVLISANIVVCHRMMSKSKLYSEFLELMEINKDKKQNV